MNSRVVVFLFACLLGLCAARPTSDDNAALAALYADLNAKAAELDSRALSGELSVEDYNRKAEIVMEAYEAKFKEYFGESQEDIDGAFSGRRTRCFQ